MIKAAEYSCIYQQVGNINVEDLLSSFGYKEYQGSNSKEGKSDRGTNKIIFQRTYPQQYKEEKDVFDGVDTHIYPHMRPLSPQSLDIGSLDIWPC
ncbi:hypothetical protein BASA62_007560 [Batrachochytrium salamandrivorans]|nr:hypothetical protein BASA62_007560 [Batrachochytrium salamandrivorans]